MNWPRKLALCVTHSERAMTADAVWRKQGGRIDIAPIDRLVLAEGRRAERVRGHTEGG